jgi:predicted RNase H-like nuclease (RuvC/YqgF family)
MVKKKTEEVKAVEVANPVESGCVDELYEVRKLLKYYHGRLKSQVGVVKDDVILTLDVCRGIQKVLGEISENCVNKVSDLAFECLRVTADRDRLKSEYEDLASEYEDMKAEYEGLKDKFADLVDENDGLRDRLLEVKRELSEKTLWKCVKEKFGKWF